MKVIITGSTGMIGKAALIECLESEHVEGILLINRSSIDIINPKVKEVLLKDFSELTNIKDKLKGFDACFHCMGVSAVGMSEDSYSQITYDMTDLLATILYELNPSIVFNYVSGTGTDSTESGRIMWARVKGKTENRILNMGFKDAYAFRPGAVLPEKGVKSKTRLYNTIYVLTKPFYPLLRKLESITPSSKLGKALINSVLYPQDLKHLENPAINKLANLDEYH
ncbi:MAG: NAD-dependent epimerase/dehydratase family protein [Reichenbachiella sp.]